MAAWPGARLRAEDARAAGELRELIVRQTLPPNAEPSLEALVETYLTPTPRFYIRSHAPTPTIAPATFRLQVGGLVERSLEFSLDELRDRFPNTDCTATLTCAGNRRIEFNAFRQVGGVQWDAGAIGNATWQGIKLSDLLAHCGLKEGAAHVWFEGLDAVEKDGETFPFGGSIPLAKALADEPARPGALLAHSMNGAPLTPDHGFPLRSLVPGYIGARSVKWLGKIVVSDRPSPNHFLQTAYKLVTEDSPQQLAAAAPLYQFPINVAICRADRVGDTIKAVGYTLPTGLPDAIPATVEVSNDGGVTWTVATFLDRPTPHRWSRWTATTPFLKSRRLLQIIARATDTAGGVTPSAVSWNLHGYMYNGWSTRTVQ